MACRLALLLLLFPSSLIADCNLVSKILNAFSGSFIISGTKVGCLLGGVGVRFFGKIFCWTEGRNFTFVGVYLG